VSTKIVIGVCPAEVSVVIGSQVRYTRAELPSSSDSPPFLFVGVGALGIAEQGIDRLADEFGHRLVLGGGQILERPCLRIRELDLGPVHGTHLEVIM
jgi:hypothetical protein